jgi:5'-nucleotidase
MVFLLTNDDGIDAPGLAALADVVAGMGPNVWVAPCVGQSGCSHRVTTGEPLRTVLRAHGQWAIEGTPADCVRLGLKRLAPELTWVLSGINHGGNLGADVHHSGTVAAVREAALHGFPGIALSHYHKRDTDIDWQRAARLLRPVVQDLVGKAWTPGTFWNINLPHLAPGAPDPEVVVCPLDRSPLPLDFREEGGHWRYDADYHERPRRPGSDVDVCFGGKIAVTLLSI